MRAWVILGAAAFLYSNVLASGDFGERIKPTVTRLTGSSSYSESSEDKMPSDSRHAGTTEDLNHTPEATFKERKPTIDVPNSSKNQRPMTHSSAQKHLNQQLSIPDDTHAVFTGEINNNPLTPLYTTVTKPPYHSNFNQEPHYMHYPNIYSNPALSPPVYQQTNNQGFPQQYQDTNYLDINNGRGKKYYNGDIDEYDDGSYDPYKYGDYVYFREYDDSYNNQDFIRQPVTAHHDQASYQQPQLPYADPTDLNNNNNFHQNHAVHQPKSVFAAPNYQQQSQAMLNQPHSNIPNYAKYSRKTNEERYRYQIDAARQYLKEIEEAQEYAKKVLAVNSPFVSAQPSEHYWNENPEQIKHSSSPTTEARYNNFQFESSHHHQTVRPHQEMYQADEVNSVLSLRNSSSHKVSPSVRQSSRKSFTGPTAMPVLLPSGFLADTDEVRLAKIAHLQLVLDTLNTVSSYKEKYPN